jgi:hypothetical protein
VEHRNKNKTTQRQILGDIHNRQKSKQILSIGSSIHDTLNDVQNIEFRNHKILSGMQCKICDEHEEKDYLFRFLPQKIDQRKGCQAISRSKIESIKENGLITVYDIETEHTHKFFGDGILVHNCQELRNNDTQKYASAKNLSNNVDYCIGLSGTIIVNYGNEVHTIYDIIKPNSLGDAIEFSLAWTNGGKVVSDPKALGAYLRDRRLFLRRTRKEVGRELPPLNTIFQTVDYDDNEIKKSDQLAASLAIKAVSGTFIERGKASRDLDIMLRKNTGIAKAREVAAFVKILLESGEPVLLAGYHRAVYDIWAEELKEYNPVMYTGTETEAQKNESKRKFISGESKVMFISLRSGAGMDGLQHVCKIVVIGELDWSPEIMKQLISRVNRDKNDIGEQEQVTVFYLICDDGSDPIMMEILGLKASQAHGIINPFDVAPKQLSDKSKLKALAEYYIKKHNIKVEADPIVS